MGTAWLRAVRNRQSCWLRGTAHMLLSSRAAESRNAATPPTSLRPRSPLEVSQGAATLGWPLARYLAALRDAGAPRQACRPALLEAMQSLVLHRC